METVLTVLAIVIVSFLAGFTAGYCSGRGE